MITVAYYVSSHGYGHGVRSCDIIRALGRIRPDIETCITSKLPESFFPNRLPDSRLSFRSRSLDVGMVQLDSIRVDIPATLERICALYDQHEALIAQETRFLRDLGVRLVVSDIAAIPLEAAALAGIPAVAVGNFGWDWIYSAYRMLDPRWEAIIRRISAGYAKAGLLLRLPFSEAMKAFRTVEEIGLVASPGKERREEMAAITGCDPRMKWILLSFTSLEWDEQALDEVAALTEYGFFTVLPLGWRRPNIHAIDRDAVSFSDVVASVDAVVSKPGFGILSDCAVNGKPLLYAERTDFLEYPVLVEGMGKYLRNAYIPAERLYRGDLREGLERLRCAPDPPLRLRSDGAEVAARHLAAFF